MVRNLSICSMQELTRKTGEGSKRIFLAVERMLQLLTTQEMSRQELVGLLCLAIETLAVAPQIEVRRVGGQGELGEDLASLLTTTSSTVRSSLTSRLPPSVSGHLGDVTVRLVRLRTEGARSVEDWRQRLAGLATSLPSLVTLIYNRQAT